MEIPGMNPLNNRINQGQITPGGPQAGVPDLILDGPRGRMPGQTAPSPAATTGPYQAPEQAIIQQSAQNLGQALMEMNLPPTPQNLQMAQTLADYGHAVNSHTLGVLKQALSGLSDRGPATVEAVVILLSKDLPVNDKTVAAIKQFLNGQPLPQQLQELPQGLTQGLQQLQQAAQQTPANPQLLGGALQQAVGGAALTENRLDGVSRAASERSTAEKVQQDPQANKALELTQTRPMQSQALPNQARDQQSLTQLQLMLKGGEMPAVEKIAAGGQILSPEETLAQLLRVLQDLGRVAGHLAQNMHLHDPKQLFVQHQQIMQLTGLLEQRLQEFHQLFGKAFPGLSQEIQNILQQDGQDTLSRLAQLLDDNLQERLRLTGSTDEKNQLLATLRQAMENLGVQVEKIQAHLVAREMLVQNQPIHVVPLMVHMNGEAYPAEVYVQQDRESGGRQADGESPLKLTLTLETRNMGRVSVELSALQQDMHLDLQVQTRRVKLKVDERLDQLKHKVEANGDYQLSRLNCRVVPDLETRQSMLLPPKREVRSLRRVEGIV